MGTYKLLSDKAVNHWPFYDEGVWKITSPRKGLNSTERKMFAAQVNTFYQKKYQLPIAIAPEHMQRLWESPRSVRRTFFLAAMRNFGFRKCAF